MEFAYGVPADNKARMLHQIKTTYMHAEFKSFMTWCSPIPSHLVDTGTDYTYNIVSFWWEVINVRDEISDLVL